MTGKVHSFQDCPGGSVSFEDLQTLAGTVFIVERGIARPGMPSGSLPPARALLESQADAELRAWISAECTAFTSGPSELPALLMAILWGEWEMQAKCEFLLVAISGRGAAERQAKDFVDRLVVKAGLAKSLLGPEERARAFRAWPCAQRRGGGEQASGCPWPASGKSVCQSLGLSNGPVSDVPYSPESRTFSLRHSC